MLGRFQNQAKTGKLVVTVAAAAVDPSGLILAGAGLDALLHAHDNLARKHPDLAKLADETQTAFTRALKDKRYDKPDGARQLLPQMFEAALPTGADFVRHGLDPDPILDDLTARLTDPEHTRPELIAAFRTLYGPLLRDVCKDPRLERALRPALIADIKRQQNRQEENLATLMAEVGGLKKALQDPGAIGFEDLCAIAAQFGETKFKDRAQVETFMAQKAQEYTDLRERLDTLRAEETQLANQLAEAEALIDAGKFDDADALLSGAEELQDERILTEVRKKARLRMTRGQSALLKGDAEAAAEHFRIAGAALQPHSVEEAALARDSGAFQLWQHGRRFGGTATSLVAELLRETTESTNPGDNPEVWGQAQNNLANALRNQGTRTAGPEGADLLAEAVTAYRAALTIYTLADHPVDWAGTQNNLGNALRNQGTRTAGPEGADLLAEAVTANRAALTVRTQADHPVNWATTQNNLANALSEQGIRTAGPEGAALLAEAVTAYRAALTVYTQADHPVRWAMTQNNLGNALRNQGTRTAGPEGADLLAEAVTAYRAALTVYTQADHPVDWAETQNNLGNALSDQGTRTAGPEGAALLAEAVTAYRAALTIRTRDDHPLDWAQTQNNLGNALAEQGIRTAGPGGAALLTDSVTVFRAALTVTTLGDHPVDWAMTQENLALVEAALADHDAIPDPAPHLRAALEHVEAALTVFDPQHMSYNFEKASRFRDRLRARLDGDGGRNVP